MSVKPKNSGSIEIGQSKHPKYQSKNIISRTLVKNFYANLHETIRNVEFNSVLDVGCGEGLVMKSMEKELRGKQCFAIDFDMNEVVDAKKNLDFCTVNQGSVYELDFADHSLDMVICTEVFEHLENPEAALKEIERVAANYVVISVPREPIWRMLNMARGSYWKDLGNTPGHLNHWSGSSFPKFISTKFDVIKVVKPLPWTIVLAKKRK